MQKTDPHLSDAAFNALLRSLKASQIETLLELMESQGWDFEAFELEAQRCGGVQRFFHIYASDEPLSPEGERAMIRIKQLEPSLEKRYRIAPAALLHATGITLDRVLARMNELGLTNWMHDDVAQIATVKELVGHDAFIRASVWVLEQFATAGRA